MACLLSYSLSLSQNLLFLTQRPEIFFFSIFSCLSCSHYNTILDLINISRTPRISFFNIYQLNSTLERSDGDNFPVWKRLHISGHSVQEKRLYDGGRVQDRRYSVRSDAGREGKPSGSAQVRRPSRLGTELHHHKFILESALVLRMKAKKIGG